MLDILRKYCEEAQKAQAVAAMLDSKIKCFQDELVAAQNDLEKQHFIIFEGERMVIEEIAKELGLRKNMCYEVHGLYGLSSWYWKYTIVLFDVSSDGKRQTHAKYFLDIYPNRRANVGTIEYRCYAPGDSSEQILLPDTIDEIEKLLEPCD